MPDSTTPEPPPALRVAIVFSGRSQREIAADAGIHETQLSRIVNEREVPSIETRSKIASALGRSVDELWPDLKAAA